MGRVKLTINGQNVEVDAGTTILEAARAASTYIPALCYHPDLPPARGSKGVAAIYHGERKIENCQPEEMGKGCGICVVEVEGETELVGSCGTEVREGMVVTTENERIREKRRENLVPILSRHRHAGLTCSQQEGCSRTQCSSNVPENERCCPQFGHCELQNVANYLGISDSTPKWLPTSFPVIKDEPLFVRDYNLCIGCTRCVRACRDLRGIEAIGFVFDAEGQVQVGTLAPTLKDSGCKFCTACVEVCPTGALADRAVRPGKREEDIVACRTACPAQIDVPGYLRLMAQGRKDEAHAVIRQKVPLPAILGRVCVHPCEQACRRAELDQPVSICALKRYAAEVNGGSWKRSIRVKADTGKKVAVIGSGPAGLTAAFYLRKQGHAITVFEAAPKPGGMMRYGIPAYRLPRDILDAEIQAILELGIELRTGVGIGKDVTIAQLREQGYEALFIAIGAQECKILGVEGESLGGVYPGVDFLRDVNLGKEISLGDRVAVVGGGNVAMDSVRTALRLGATKPFVIYRRGLEEMPASPEEIEECRAEGIEIMTLTNPVRIIGHNGRVSAIECIRMRLGDPDASGRRRPEPVPGSELLLEVDAVIPAIGQESDWACLTPECTCQLSSWGTMEVDPLTLQSADPDIFAGGDAVTGPRTVIEAIAAGRKGAAAIDKALGGSGDIEEVLFETGTPNPYFGREEQFAARGRQAMPKMNPGDRIGTFHEVALGFGAEQAVREAGRCLQCDARLYLGGNPSPPARVLPFHAESVSQVPDAEGVYQLLDKDHNVLAIKGTQTLRSSLLEALEENQSAAWFEFEEDKMYSMRESELLQRYLQEHGKMPGGDDEDLF